MLRARELLLAGQALVFALVISAACDAGRELSDDGALEPSSDGEPSPGGPSAPDAGKPVPAASASGDLGAASRVPYVHFDVNHVLSTGQSNSVAHEGRPVLTTTQPYGNLMFDVGVMTSGECEREGCRTYQQPSSFVPLVEGDSFWYPVETASSSLANEATKLAKNVYGKSTHDVLVSLHGRNGLTLWCIRRGSCNFVDRAYLQPFDEGMKQIADAKRIALAAGKSYVVRAVTLVHGESDDYAYGSGTNEFPLDGTDGREKSVRDYADGLLELQRDYEAGAVAATGQTQPVPLLLSQFSSWNDFPESVVTQLQLDAHVRSGGKVAIATPGYILDFHEDCRHYSNHGERQLGEYFGKAYARIVIDGARWEPLRPESATLAGDVVTARFIVPVPPLVLDTTRVVDPGDFGFEVVDEANARLAIARVALAGPDTVAITLATTPTSKLRLRYAFTHAPQTCAGKKEGARGNLRDSDTTPSQYGYDLFNWAVHFSIPVD